MIPVAIAAAVVLIGLLATSRKASASMARPSYQSKATPLAVPKKTILPKVVYPGMYYDEAAGSILSTFIPYTTKETEDETVLRKSSLVTFTFDGIWVLESPWSILSTVEKKLGRKIGMTALVLATMIASEAGKQPIVARQGIGHAALNEARRKGIHPLALIIPDGRFARQGLKSGHGYAASGQPPSEIDIKVAEGILAGTMPDPTYGSTNFDSPNAQRAALARGVSEYTKTPEDVAAERESRGMVAVGVPGMTKDQLRFWRYS